MSPKIAMRAGSATPLASTTTCSGGSSTSRSLASAAMKSPPMPQQMQPLVSVIISPARDSTSSPSMSIAPKSLTSTASLRSPASRSTLLSSVVLPAPR
jgi:hypothetical protein